MNKVESTDYSLYYYGTPNPVAGARKFLREKRSVKIRKIDDETYVTKQLFHAVQQGSLNILESISSKAWRDRLSVLDDKNHYSLLHYASLEDHEDILLFLLELNPDVNICGPKKIRPIHLAAQMGHLKIIQILCDQKNIQIDATDIKGQTALHLACRRGHHEAVKILIQNKASVYKLELDSMSVMHDPARKNDVTMIQILIASGAPLNIQNSNGITPLMITAIEGHTELFTMYLQEIQISGVSKRLLLDEKDNDGLSCLSHAVQNINTEIVTICIKNNADLYTRQNDGKTIFHTAATMGYTELFKIIESKLIDFAVMDNNLNTPLHHAILDNNLDMVKLIVGLGAPANLCNRDFLTPTLLACKELSENNNTTNIIKYLVDANVDLKIRDNDMRTILHHLVLKQNIDLLKYVIGKLDPKFRQKLINLQDINRDGPLHCAVRLGNAEITKYLLANGADPLTLSDNDFLPLHIATKEGHLNCVLLLLEASKTTSNYRDINENMAIHIAAASGRVDIFQYLVNKGKDKFARDEFGRNTLMFASRSGSLDIVKLLLQSEVNLNLSDQMKNTALHEASMSGHLDVVQSLWDHGATLSGNIFDHTPLDVALFNNQVEVARFFLNDKNWKVTMSFRHRNGSSHIKNLIKHNSELTAELLNKCITENTTNKMDPDYEITYWFGLLDAGPEDAASIRKRYFALTSMTRYKKIELLQHPLSQKFLELKWARFGMAFFIVDLILYLFYLTCLTVYMSINTPISGNATFDPDSGCYKPSTSTSSVARSTASTSVTFLNSLIYASVGIRLILQLIKLLSQLHRYFLEFWNYLFLACHIIIFWFIRNPTNVPCLYEWQFGAAVAFISWFLLVYYLQYFPVIGIEVVMFQKVAVTAIRVMLIFFCIFVGFAYGFYIVNNNQSPFINVQTALLKTLAMMIGELEIVSYFISNVGNYNAIGNTLIAVFMIIMCIAFLNLLIGLAVGDIDRISSEATLEMIKLKVAYVWEVESKLPIRIQNLLNSTQVYEKPSKNYKSLGSRLSRQLKPENVTRNNSDNQMSFANLKSIDAKIDALQKKIDHH